MDKMTWSDPKLISLPDWVMGLYEFAVKNGFGKPLQIDSAKSLTQAAIFEIGEPGTHVTTVRDIIQSTYQGVENTIIQWREDPELPGCAKLNFQIHLRSEPEQILKDEAVFYDKFFKSIPEDMQDRFVITYRVT